MIIVHLMYCLLLYRSQPAFTAEQAEMLKSSQLFQQRTANAVPAPAAAPVEGCVVKKTKKRNNIWASVLGEQVRLSFSNI